MPTNKIKTAFILGAGLGTRLRPLTEKTPKPLLPIGGRPMITYVIEHLRAIGVQKFIINTHHCAEKYAEVFPENNWQGIPITFRHEKVLLDTAGGIKNIEDLIAADERIIVYNGDIITNMPLELLVRKHFERKTEVTLALRSFGPLLNVNIDQEGFVCDMRHILNNEGVKSCLFAGIYIVEKSFLKRLTAGKIESIVLPLVEMIKENPRSVGAVVIDDGHWYDVGSLEEYEKILENNLGTTKYGLVPIKKGGSDRSFFRVLMPDSQSFIFMHYGTEVDENGYWADINKFLAGLEISVPQIVAQDIRQHFLLLEDLGDVDLWSQRALPWDRRRDYYFQVLTQIHRLHAYPLAKMPADLKLSESYGPRLYSWEHDYFLENLVLEVCQIKHPESLLKELKKELELLSTRLQKIEPCLIHRDFQSQNIMIKNGKPVLIDFQGMRRGCLFYDLGSLICDPYVTFTATERNELIAFYYDLMKPSYSLDEFSGHFWEGSAQRLMQALGAYGFLGLKKNKPAFLKHINNGLTNLLAALDHAPGLARLKELAVRCDTVVKNQ